VSCEVCRRINGHANYCPEAKLIDLDACAKAAKSASEDAVYYNGRRVTNWRAVAAAVLRAAGIEVPK